MMIDRTASMMASASVLLIQSGVISDHATTPVSSTTRAVGKGSSHVPVPVTSPKCVDAACRVAELASKVMPSWRARWLSRSVATMVKSSALRCCISESFEETCGLIATTALLGACGGDLQGLRDAALLSLGYNARLRVSVLVAVRVAHIDPHSDGSALLFIHSSKTDQEGQGARGWLSADMMRRVGARLAPLSNKARRADQMQNA